MTLRWALVGTGRVHDAMAPAIAQARGAELKAVLSRDPVRAAAFAHKHGIERVYHALDDLLRDPDIDVVYVASPNGLHAQQAMRAAAAGKHVFCEKPMALTLADCRAVIAACREHGVRLGLGVMYRQHAAHRKAREMVAAGELGRIRLAKAQMELAWRVEQPAWYFDPGMAGGGVVYMAGVHRIDLLRYMLGSEIDEVRALVGDHAPDRPYEESALAMLRFDDGTRGLLNFNLDLPHGTSNIEIHGEKGSIVLQDTMLQWWGGGGGELVLKTDAGTVRHPFDKPDLYRAEVEDFNRAITDGTAPAGTGEDGLRATEVCLALFEAGRSGRAVRVRELPG